MPRRIPDFDMVRDIAVSLPDVKESTTRLGRSLRMRGQLLACQAIHRSAEPDSVVVRIGLADRARLLAERPAAYYVTDHYAPYPSVLIRLSKTDRESLRSVLETAWKYVSAQANRGGRTHGQRKRVGSPPSGSTRRM
jgi:hypothetical protein